MYPFVIDLETVAIPDAADYLEPVSAPSNWKDEAKIAAYVKEAQAEVLGKAALDIDLARIVALGISQPGHDTRVLTTQHETEVSILTWLWDQWGRVPYGERQMVTFNGLSYDVNLLLRRSMYLGVKAPHIQTDRFKHPEVIDLFAILSRDGQQKPWHGLQFYLSRLGYPKAGPDITGAEIAARYAAGDWAAIEQHCRMDVEATKWLAERIGAIPKTQPVGETAGAF